MTIAVALALYELFVALSYSSPRPLTGDCSTDLVEGKRIKRHLGSHGCGNSRRQHLQGFSRYPYIVAAARRVREERRRRGRSLSTECVSRRCARECVVASVSITRNQHGQAENLMSDLGYRVVVSTAALPVAR